MNRKRQKIIIDSEMIAKNIEADEKPLEDTQKTSVQNEPLPGCSRDWDFAGLSYHINGDSVEVYGSLLTEELELLLPGREFFLMEKKKKLYKRLADLYESLKLEDAEDKKKKTKLPTKNLSIG